MSLTLGGFAASNYYNKVKLALLEKEIPFAEELAMAVRRTTRSSTHRRGARCRTCGWAARRCASRR